MERRITEERITKSIIAWLENNGWEIICFDFPQSGTGKALHSNDRSGLKNKDTIIPDIVAIKGKKVVFFENKDRFVPADFLKVKNLKNGNDYSDSISDLLRLYTYDNIYYGVGLPINLRNKNSVNKNKDKVDFIINSDGEVVKIIYQVKNIFL